MRKNVFMWTATILAGLFLFGCGSQSNVGARPTETVETTGAVETTEVPETETSIETEPSAPEHSELYIPDVSVDDVVRYFNEVCLDAEIVNSGDPGKLQRWEGRIRYYCDGPATDEDHMVLESMVNWLNTIEGFPGMSEVSDPDAANLHISFCGPDEYLAFMGENFHGTDGGVTFWYDGFDRIYDGIIGYRTDIDQETRNSVILEEIYNGLGPINDTALRDDSIIYSGFSTPQWLTPVDELIIKLLYHPQMECGMDATACETVIRQIYY